LAVGRPSPPHCQDGAGRLNRPSGSRINTFWSSDASPSLTRTQRAPTRSQTAGTTLLWPHPTPSQTQTVQPVLPFTGLNSPEGGGGCRRWPLRHRRGQQSGAETAGGVTRVAAHRGAGSVRRCWTNVVGIGRQTTRLWQFQAAQRSTNIGARLRADRPLMHREHLTSLQAFALLLKTSQNANIKLVERPDDTTATEEASKDPDPQN
jgi:hypothetical protein